MTDVSRMNLDHPELDDPGGAPLHAQVEDLYVALGDAMSSRYYEGIAVANNATVAFAHNFKMPFSELTFVVYTLAGAGGELTVADQNDYLVSATVGLLTTSVDVQNISGGVSTFALIIQSIGGSGGGGGGGGQTLYDVIIDAAGGGDYTSIKDACDGETNDTTMWIRNGTYTESLTIEIKNGQKLIGESVDGVVLESSSAQIFTPPRVSFDKRGCTQRLTDNTDWDDATNIGRITVTQNSLSATYSGPTAVFANDTCVIGPGWGNKFGLSNAGVGTIDLDRTWEGESGTYDWIVWRSPQDATWKEQEHSLKNLTIKASVSGARCIAMNNTVGFVCENINYYTAATSSTAAFIYSNSKDNACNIFRNIKFQGASPGLTPSPFFYFTGSCTGRMRLENIRCNRSKGNQLSGTAVTPLHYLNMHFLEISNSDVWMSTQNYISHSTFKFDEVTDNNGSFMFPPSAVLYFYKCDFEVESFTNSGDWNLSGGKCRISLKRFEDGVFNAKVPPTWSADYAYRNMLHDSYIDGQINADVADGGGLIISSSVIYSSLADSFEGVIDNGLNYNSPPGPVTAGQTLYDYIVDAAGGGDYTSFKLALDAAQKGETIFVRNGTYNETVNITFREGVKVIGESYGGVIITQTQINMLFPNVGNWQVRCATQRLATNLGWDASTSLGTLTLTNGSITILYAGAIAPVAGDAIIIGKSFVAEVVSAGVGTFNIDREWDGQTTTTGDGVVSLKLPDSFEGRTLFKNLIFDHSGVAADTSCLHLNGAASGVYGFEMEDCTYLVDNDGFGHFGLFDMQIGASTAKTRFKNVTMKNLNSGCRGFSMSSGTHVDFQMIDCTMINSDRAYLFGTAIDPHRYNSYHFKSFTGASQGVFQLIGFQIKCKFHFENITGAGSFQTGAGTVGAEDYFECSLKLEKSSVATMTLIGWYNSIIELGTLEGNTVSLTEKAASGGVNILTNTLLPTQTLTVDASVVISGSTAYKVLAGAPAQNNGYDIP